MHDLKVLIEQLKNDLQKEIKQVTSLVDLEQLRVKYLGRNGSISAAMAQLKELSVEDKKTIAPALNELKKVAEELYAATQANLQENRTKSDLAHKQHFDVTAYKTAPTSGSLHIFTKIV